METTPLHRCKAQLIGITRDSVRITSPSGRSMYISLDAVGPMLNEQEFAIIDKLFGRTVDIEASNNAWHAEQREMLSSLKAASKKNWIADLPEYVQYMAAFRKRIPPLAGQVYLDLTVKEMELIRRVALGTKA